MDIIRYTICIITFVLISFFLSFSFDETSDAASLEEYKEALKIISEFANKMCDKIPIEGEAGNVELSGEANAELSGLLKKLVDLGIEGAGAFQKSEYEGVLRKDLAVTLKDCRDCKLVIFNHLKDIFFQEQEHEQRTYPEFPWPPPQASATVIITKELLSTPIRQVVYLGDIDMIMRTALEASGYIEKSYFAVPDGFALVTRLEQINSDGSPKELPDRWSTEVRAMRQFTLKEYLRALFTANPGHYRIIVLIVTSYPFSQSDKIVDQKGAVDWLRRGLNKLPPLIASKLYTNQYTTTG